MSKFLGLRTRLCPNCREIVAHKTLYVKTETNGRSRWPRIFWACTRCNTLNHVILPTYRLESVPSELPSPLVTGVVEALRGRPLDFDELIQTLRGHCPGVRHVFNSEVALALEFLERRGIVAEQAEDVTERTLGELRAKSAASSRLGLCPAEAERGSVKKGVVSVYAQHRQVAKASEGNHVGRLKLSPVGVLCIRCGYSRLDPALVAKP
ncbi:MAG: hypothetical protein JRN45_09260 [Nitrososphaerota archaeon]|nr:hypothetical protein [Nitrososphaerota archaeon]